jgi:hypothetical protein
MPNPGHQPLVSTGANARPRDARKPWEDHGHTDGSGHPVGSCRSLELPGSGRKERSRHQASASQQALANLLARTERRQMSR